MSSRPPIRNAHAAEVVSRHFGKPPTRVRRLTGGLSNHVFEAALGRDTFVVRISEDPAKLQTFLKEQWAVRKARAHQVPAPEVLEVGNTAVPFPYMIAVKVRGLDATSCPCQLETVRAMGVLAARINSVRTSGFGCVFDWSRNQLSRNNTWAHFLDDEVKVGERLDLLASQRMLRPQSLQKLRSQVRSLRSWKGLPALTHGDVRFKNVILDKAGKITSLLDWENCTSNLAPHWELSIALHDLSIDQKEAFLEGYGLAPREFEKISGAVKCLNILNYAPAIQEALRAKDRSALQSLRARLHGAFDLQSV